ncbi:MAG: glycoside hydrolase family 3 N-terminal domain-containing protein [Gemmiger sp.]|nr:glycoside hydrolase family 3 N-terminal domain-containing protein [Gemmiger sp.]
MKKNNTTRVVAATLSVAMVAASLAGCGKAASSTPASSAPTTETAGESGYIEAPNTAESGKPLTEYVAPVFYQNEDGPEIGTTFTGVIQENGQYFRDSNNNKTLDTYEDWRLPTSERVADLVSRMTQEQRIGLLKNALVTSPSVKTAEEVYDENGNVKLDTLVTLPAETAETAAKDEGSLGDRFQAAMAAAFATENITEANNRSGVIRANTDTETGALFNNTLNAIAEQDAAAKGEVVIPYVILSNPMNSGFPSNLGFGAVAAGDGNGDAIKKFAEMDAEIWDAKGIHQMYGPQIDIVTDPRWPRNSGTYTEDPAVMTDIVTALIEGYQHGTDGTQPGDVALIMKHFPGDGAAENGFESHYGMGQWRIYETEGSLETYQMPGFQAAVDAGVAGIMPSYSRPATDARSVPQSYKGVELTPEEIGSAYNTTILQTLLKDTLGFTGFINSDSNIITTQFWGAEDMTEAERYAGVINAGCDVVGDGFTPVLDYTAVAEAVTTGLVTEEAFDRATTNRMESWIDLGMFENPYRDPAESKAVGADENATIADITTEINRKSVVLMKNSNATLPLTDTSKKVYLASYSNSGEKEDAVTAWTTAIEAAGYTLVDDETTADIAILDVVPGGVSQSDEYMHTLDLVENLEVNHVAPATQIPDGTTVEVTTLQDVKKISKVADAVHANGGVVVASVDISSPWILTNLEPYCDALLGSFTSSAQARMDLLTGQYAPTGKLPVSMVSCEEVIAVTATELSDGKTYQVCASPNDVPGYDKDQYIDAAVLATSPSGSYAYKDADGNLYKSGYGLTMDVSNVKAPAASAPAESKKEDTKTETAGAATSDKALVVNYDAKPDEFVGKWVLTGAYTADDGMLPVEADACTLDIEESIDANKLVDEPNYIHADAINLSGTMSFNHAGIDVDDYKCSSNWKDWTTVNVIGEGNAEFSGANKFKIRDDDEGLFFDVLTGTTVEDMELMDAIAVNADGQLIVGYSDGHINTDQKATWEYAYIFTKA